MRVVEHTDGDAARARLVFSSSAHDGSAILVIGV
jgi:hypothetical protein